MINPFKQAKKIAEEHSLSAEQLVHALMATVLLECCPECNDRLHSQAFFQAFDQMVSALSHCKDLADRNAA